MNNTYKVLALDLDGTLTNSKKIITERTKRALKLAMEKGIIVVLASGRPVLGIQNLADELELDQYGGYILAFNGGKVINCKSKEVIYQQIILSEYTKEICDFAREHQVSALTYDTKGVVAENCVDPYVIKEAQNNGITISTVEDLGEYVDYPVEKFMIVGEPEKIEGVLPLLQKQFEGRLNIFCSESYFIEIMPLNVEKSYAMKKLLEVLNVPVEEFMACGDGLNDIPLLEYAGFAVAMENAYEQVKEISDYISTSNDEDGVGLAVEKFILGKTCGF